MPEYLAPGVFIEEVSFRPKSIEGVSTSTAAFVGPTRYGPVNGDPELITSQLDFERIYGGLENLSFPNKPDTTNYLAHAVRAFFEEGGKRLYVSRTFRFADDFKLDDEGLPNKHYGMTTTELVSPPEKQITLLARFPGAAGNMRVTFTIRRGANVYKPAPPDSPAGGGAATLTRVQDHDVVFVRKGSAAVRGDGLFTTRWDAVNRRWGLRGNGSEMLLDDPDLAGAQILPVTVTVEVEPPDENSPGGFGSSQLVGEFGFDKRAGNGLTNTFAKEPSTRFRYLTIPFAIHVPKDFETDEEKLPLSLVRELLGYEVVSTLGNDPPALVKRRQVYTLRENLEAGFGATGDDGVLPDDTAYAGDPTPKKDYIGDALLMPKNGLLAFEAVEDISIVAAPGYTGADRNQDDALGIQNALINHCEKMRYRIAVLDTPPDFLPTQAADFRNLRSSKYAAMYYPWVTVADPLGDGRLILPPSGFVAGIYARNDNDRAVFKAPANEVVRLAIDFEQRINKNQQELLNPDGVNCLRFFSGHGFLVWGARTISDDPEWKYVNLRRYFAYLEHSIDRGTQWVVFENNSKQLWDNVRRTVEDFLYNEWKMGGLMGEKPEQAYFVRCDLSTMTQNDLDNGRLVCLIGVAPVRPAEFVIFRIGQITATGNR